MAGPAAIFLEIHRLRIFAGELQERLDFAPKQLKAQQAILAKREAELKEGQEKVKKLKVEIHEHEVSIKAAQQQIKEYEQQLNDITSKKEYDALRHEISNVQNNIRAIEDEMLNVMMALDERAAQIPPLEEAIRRAQAELAEFERDFQERLKDWARQRDQAMGQIAAEESKLPGEIRPQYDRLVKAMGADALAAIEGKSCASCLTEMTAQLQHNALLGQFVLCRNCGRLLYLKNG